MIKKIINKLPEDSHEDLVGIKWIDCDCLELSFEKSHDNCFYTAIYFQINVQDDLITHIDCQISQRYEGEACTEIEIYRDDIEFMKKIIDWLLPICSECLTRPGHYISDTLPGVYCEECAKALADVDYASFMLDQE